MFSDHTDDDVLPSGQMVSNTFDHHANEQCFRMFEKMFAFAQMFSNTIKQGAQTRNVWSPNNI